MIIVTRVFHTFELTLMTRVGAVVTLACCRLGPGMEFPHGGGDRGSVWCLIVIDVTNVLPAFGSAALSRR